MQGFNKYYPPDYDPDKHSSLNSYHGKHALGDRARKIDQGILVVRFELPFNMWCGTCNAHIGQGVRYNAEKKQVGSYYSTKIWSFRFKCHLCSGRIEIRTDPQNTRYVVTEGARQKNEEADDPEADGMLVVDTSASTSASAAPPDPFASLEKSVSQKAAALSTSARLSALHEQNSTSWDDPFSASLKLRASFRKRKKEELGREGRAKGLAEKVGLGAALGQGGGEEGEAERRRVLKALETPARGSEEEKREREEWEIARVEGEKRRREGEGKRRREEESFFGSSLSSTSASSSSRRRHSDAHRPSSSSSASSSSALRRSSSSRTIAALPSRASPSARSSSDTSKPASPAALALHSKLSLATRLKRDPFAAAATASQSSALSGLGMATSRSAPAGLAGLGGTSGAGGGGVEVKVKKRRLG
ncbi:hypothetical protein JCM8097_003507 [Rhodosporidiobolus ruineniae]